MPRIGKILFLAIVLGGIGCAQRTLDITSEPAGAIVYLNGEEIGRTPLRYDFEWYSDYEVILRLDGYETLKTNRAIKAPLIEVPPLDLCAELFGHKDRRQWHFTMKPEEEKPVDSKTIFGSAVELRNELRSSKYTRQPTTFPTTRSTTRPATGFPF